ncbi:hypothetical protein A9D46_18010 [Photobacterium damselae subsp. damselae]|uniref:hypothetical protein n=1 Tax=Photobacterium damselae TaxID=38293 RepID=UPI00084A4478|nr:hypothetical protein [Photobacterium damselae]OEC81426.1 hypothetical protein A9D46_18010 [Photobacterium damselae subsp. damselae]
MKLGLNMSLSFNKIVISLLSLSLFGCGGSDDGDVTEGNTPPQKVSISAQDALKFAQLNTKTTIDLRQRVQAQNNESLLLSDVKTINGDCDILSIDGLSFDIYSRNADVCRFEYSVTPTSDKYTGSAKAVAQIVANEESTQGQYLPPVSRAMQKNEIINFNTSDLGIQVGYELDPQSVVVLNGTGTDEIGELANISDSGFDYTAPNTETIVRIFYSVINRTDNIVKPGIIYIAIGQNTNISPNALDRTLDQTTLIETNKIINVEDFVSDVDDDELQLVYVRGTIGNTDITGNLEFRYRTTTTGHEYVTYIVSDHNGGYGIGLLDFTISTYPPISDPAQKLIFLPPMTMSSPELVTSSGSQYEVGADGFQGFYPIFSHALASSYCTTQGARLPTEQELTSMWKNVLNESVFKSEFKWHSTLAYLTDSPTQQVSLKNGQGTTQQNPAYFSCVISTEEPGWEFSQSFIQTHLDTPFNVYEIAQIDGMMIYRKAEDYKLVAKTEKYLINGQEADTDQIITEIDNNKITIHTKEPTSEQQIYVKVNISDEAIPNRSINVTIGFKQCKKGTAPEQALLEGCIYTIELDNGQRFTLAIPKNLINGELADTLPAKIFGKDGAAFIGTKKSNTDEWHSFLRNTCDVMNILEIDGKSNWVPGIPLRQQQLTYGTIEDETDQEAMTAWTIFLAAMDSSTDAAAYGAGFAGMPNTKYVVNQSSSMRVRTELAEYAWTFASCVTEK